jgi:formylglycine-generating enzyme required for sulfatase activity
MKSNFPTAIAILFSIVGCASQLPVAEKSFTDCQTCPEMIVIPAGHFEMGSNEHDEEKPIHHIVISKAFALGKTEVTQGQWKDIMGNNPSYYKECGDDCPVEQISWKDAKEFVQKLTAKTNKQYRLPSEAEWEYACRAGNNNEYCGSDKIDGVGWYGAHSYPKGNSRKSTNPVATKLPNLWGLYDMSGNVWEWVEDNFHDNYVDNDNNKNEAPTDGSAWQGDDEMRVIRGGSWVSEPQNVRATGRAGDAPSIRNYDYGFRLARTLP